jgi:hypothetical protein
MDKVNMTENKNRRDFFRIYEEANLFYKKIDEQTVIEPYPVFEATSSSIDPENVNLSVTGIAFTCENTLKKGDYLVMKIVLASGVKNIVTYAKVVYCKKSTADNLRPYFVGAHFIDMKDQYRDLLAKYVDKKRLQQRWVHGFILAAILSVIAAPATIFGLLIEVLHFLLELGLELTHLAFEFIESNLDHLIEHLFETDLHQTQVIVFYIILPVFIYGLYRLWRVVPSFCLRCKKKQLTYWSRMQASLLYYWQEQTLFNKIKLVVIGVAVITAYVFFGI